MGDSLDDVNDFIQQASGGDDSGPSEPTSNRRRSLGYDDYDPDDEENKKNQGLSSQYARYNGGFTATSDTIKSLPPACYNIEADNRCIYVTPTLEPAGLLLELPEMQSEQVIQAVESFWASESDYKNGNDYVHGGAIYKDGILIWGPPGSGKSCTLKIVSKKLVIRGGTVFYANGHPIHVQKFLTDFARIENNRKCIVIFEDIDALIQKYGESDYLEILDSAKTINNVMFIATTNYPERLDPRIYNRPGRFADVVKIGLPSAVTRRAYLKAILKDHKDIETIVAETDNFTIDHLTALVNAVYRKKRDLKKEIARLKALFKVKPKSDDTESGGGITLGRRD